MAFKVFGREYFTRCLLVTLDVHQLLQDRLDDMVLSEDITSPYINLRHQHPAWLLLASRRAPLLLSCFKQLFQQAHNSIRVDDALQALADTLRLHANNLEFDIASDDYPAQARKELRDWIKRGLVVERDGALSATDALQRTLEFVDGLDQRIMTSSASRLATVQREIENLEVRLNPNPQSRIEQVKRNIRQLEEELKQIESGHFSVLDGAKAVEAIRDIYQLAISLRADFRRVEDSYREADRQLRQSIISDNYHRGAIVDSLLDSHDNLLATPEGQVFHGFYEQLNRSVELDNMKQRVRNILRNPNIDKALNRQQQVELRWLIAQLVAESASVIRARARSEKDVKAFMKSGLAAEQHRVSELLREILHVALDIDWASSSVRRSFVALPVVGVPVAGLPLIERFRCKSLEVADSSLLEFTEQKIDINDIDDDFWGVFDSLDRDAFLQETLQVLADSGSEMTIAELANHIPPSHDLENVALWLSMAREADVPVHTEQEALDIVDRDSKKIRFSIPKVALSAAALADIEWEL